MTTGNIDIRAARHFVALAKHLSFTHAAEELGITQSALSRSIQRFEETIKVRLFDRNRGGVYLTVVGRELAKRAMILVQEAIEFERMIHQSARGLQDSVVFGMGHLPAKSLLPQVLVQELSENPSLHVKAYVRGPETLLSMLLLDELEFLVCAEALIPDDAPVRRSAIGVYRLDQLVRPGHPLLDKEQDRQPREFPWIVAAQIGGEQSIEEGHFLSHLRQRPQLEIENIDCLGWITQHTDAIWVTSRTTAIPELDAGLLCKLSMGSLYESPPIKVMMYSRSDRSLSPAAVRLRDRFRSAAQAFA